jgi:predicted metal-binding protein
VNEASAPWTHLLLVCTSCRGARHGTDPRGIRKQVKRALGKDRLRVLEVKCLELCPDDAIAVCLVDARGARCLLVQSDGDVESLTQQIAAG